MALLGITLALLVGCGGSGETTEAQALVAQGSDLPSRFSVNLAESFPVPLETVLGEPWSVSVRDVIQRERLSGYQAAFTSDRVRHIQCNAAVYRSGPGAARVFGARAKHFARFAVASGGGSSARLALGDETRNFRYRLGSQAAVTVAWRSRSVLSSCTTVDRAPDLAELLVVARAQQSRITRSRAGAR